MNTRAYLNKESTQVDGLFTVDGVTTVINPFFPGQRAIGIHEVFLLSSSANIVVDIFHYNCKLEAAVGQELLEVMNDVKYDQELSFIGHEPNHYDHRRTFVTLKVFFDSCLFLCPESL